MNHCAYVLPRRAHSKSERELFDRLSASPKTALLYGSLGHSTKRTHVYTTNPVIISSCDLVIREIGFSKGAPHVQVPPHDSVAALQLGPIRSLSAEDIHSGVALEGSCSYRVLDFVHQKHSLLRFGLSDGHFPEVRQDGHCGRLSSIIAEES